MLEQIDRDPNFIERFKRAVNLRTYTCSLKDSPENRRAIRALLLQKGIQHWLINRDQAIRDKFTCPEGQFLLMVKATKVEAAIIEHSVAQLPK